VRDGEVAHISRMVQVGVLGKVTQSKELEEVREPALWVSEGCAFQEEQGAVQRP